MHLSNHIGKAALAAVVAIGLTPVTASASIIAPSLATGTLEFTTSSQEYHDTGQEAVHLTDTDAGNDDATALLLLELAGYAQWNTFGIYGFTGSGAGVVLGNTLQVFAGSASPLTSATLRFDLSAGTVTNLDTSITANIGSTFGFYLVDPFGNTFYSHTALNSDGVDHVKLFDTSNNVVGELLGSDVVVAFEDLLGGGDLNFSDMVVGVTDVLPVPEPGTLALLGAGLAGLAARRRRRLAV